MKHRADAGRYTFDPGVVVGQHGRVQPHSTPVLPASPALRDGPDLLLRRLDRRDLPGIYEQCQDEEMQRWTTIPVPYTRDSAQQFLDDVQQGWDDSSVASLAIELEGRFAGTVSLRLDAAGWAEIGFGLGPWARGRGVMSRSVALTLDWGFGELGLLGVQWRAAAGNEASRRVAEKLGFRLEGTVRGLVLHRGQRVDGWIGSLLATEHTWRGVTP